MSRHFSKYSLNTYCGTPYFQAHVPADYPLSLVLQKSRTFRRLPPHLRELSTLSKQWADRIGAASNGIEEWYDDEGYELNPSTGKRLTDKEIDDEWEGYLLPDDFKVKDIPIPKGGFADPDTWEKPPPEEPEVWRPTDEQLLRDIASRGRHHTAKEYNIPEDELPDGN